MKIYAMYLPQFHEVKENSEWWGNGYTDWVAAKQAESYYNGHMQPRSPLNDNYYDLLQKDTMVWQAKLMQKYGIDGVCMYHYWFKDGERILEKPAENLLKWNGIQMSFCFYWDNNRWVRSWSKFERGNEWNPKFENERHGKEVLFEQEYGSEKAWREHFDYLLPFFRDKRYIRIDEKPVFMILRTDIIDCFEVMMQKWNEWAKEEGMDGIYCIGADNLRVDREGLNAELHHVPYMLHRKIIKSDSSKGPLRLSYDQYWKTNLEQIRKMGKYYYSGFVGFDDTPRRGEKGKVIEGQTPEKFKQYFSELLAKSEAAGNDITFLNAWNEWGEAMYLEPDKENGYAYLEAVAYAKENYHQYIEKYKMLKKGVSDQIVSEISILEQTNDKYCYLWTMFERWMSIKESDKGLQQYFKDHNINTIAIYGLGALGRHLIKELENTDIKVVFGIDQIKEKKGIDIPIYSMNEAWPQAEAIVLTMVHAQCMKWKVDGKSTAIVITLEEILKYMEWEA